MTRPLLPPRQQLAAPGKWPVVGEREPAFSAEPWALEITGCVSAPKKWSLAELASMKQVEHVVDIHCVTRWSMMGAKLAGVPLINLLEMVQPTDAARFVSFVARSTRQHSSSLPLADCLQLQTFIALSYAGQPLTIEHGGPFRSIVPGRYFYKSVKWLTRIELLTDDRRGFWEATAGYHNHADPWLEERFVASTITRQQAVEILNTRDIAGRELLGLDASNRDLEGLRATNALLRNANFRHANLQRANFDGANLSNAVFHEADLRDASFVKSDLEGASFAAADLRGADLGGASLFGATFVDLAQNIQHAAHLDASTQIDTDAIEALTPEQAEFVRGRIRLER